MSETETDIERRARANSSEPFDGRPCTVKRGGDPLLTRLMAEHGGRRPAPVIARVADPANDGKLKFAAIIDSDGTQHKIKEFAGGVERWIDAQDIIEAE